MNMNMYAEKAMLKIADKTIAKKVARKPAIKTLYEMISEERSNEWRSRKPITLSPKFLVSVKPVAKLGLTGIPALCRPIASHSTATDYAVASTTAVFSACHQDEPSRDQSGR